MLAFALADGRRAVVVGRTVLLTSAPCVQHSERTGRPARQLLGPPVRGTAGAFPREQFETTGCLHTRHRYGSIIPLAAGAQSPSLDAPTPSRSSHQDQVPVALAPPSARQSLPSLPQHHSPPFSPACSVHHWPTEPSNQPNPPPLLLPPGHPTVLCRCAFACLARDRRFGLDSTRRRDSPRLRLVPTCRPARPARPALPASTDGTRCIALCTAFCASPPLLDTRPPFALQG